MGARLRGPGRTAQQDGRPPVDRRWARVGLFVAASLLANGLTVGVADHALHLPMIDAVLHPQRWAGDAMVQAAGAHPTLWFAAMAPGLEAFGLGWMVAMHLLVVAATGWAIAALAGELFDEAAELPALLVLAAGHAAIGGAPTLDPLLLPRGAALPLELAAWTLALRGRAGWAFALLGATAWLHAPSAAGATAALAAWQVRQAKPWAPGIAGVVALPVVAVWAGDPGPLVMDEAWWAVVRARLAHHVWPAAWGVQVWLGLAAWLGIGLVATQGAQRGFLRAVLGGALVWMALGAVGGAAKLALAVQLEPWQAGRFVVIAAGVALGGAARGPSAAVLAAAARAPLLALPLALFPTTRAGPRSPALWGLAALLLALSARHPLDGSYPRRTQLAPPADVVALGDWLAQHSAEGERFAGPPAGLDGLRARAKRPTVVTWKDGGEAQFDRAYARAWRARIHEACACQAVDAPLPVRAPLGLRSAALRAALMEGWSARPLAERKAWAKQHGARWLVAEPSPGAAFEHGRWAIHPVEATAAAPASP